MSVLQKLAQTKRKAESGRVLDPPLRMETERYRIWMAGAEADDWTAAARAATLRATAKAGAFNQIAPNPADRNGCSYAASN
jgi:hypothetical protein